MNNENIKNALNELIVNKQFNINIKELDWYKGKDRAAEVILDVAVAGVDHLITRW